jgi:hypothetical protein
MTIPRPIPAVTGLKTPEALFEIDGVEEVMARPLQVRDMGV